MIPITERSNNIPPFIVMDVLERAHALEREGRHIIHLGVGEPDFPTPACVCEAAIEAIFKRNRPTIHTALG
jgi:aspartate/methionine/tyrosine aminotransferase